MSGNPDFAPLAGMLDARAYPHPVTRLTLRETHISWVVLTGEFAYKIKKPVRLDFLDATTLPSRRRFCEEELRLNRRTAPELYLAVVPITREQTGRLQLDGPGTVFEYAVRMRQFASADELPALLESDVVTAADVADLATLLADFHAHAAVATSAAHEHTGSLYRAVLDNLAQVSQLVDPHEQRTDVRRLSDWTLAAARSLQEILMQRENMGFVRDCHGDLHAGNIVRFRGRLIPFDCIEFALQLRLIDVLNDLAFLVMDLASYREDLAFILLNRYLEITGDYAGLRLLPFYAVYRALVRAKVDALAARSVPKRADEFHARGERRLATETHWIAFGTPTLILMHGASGSGKSWLSERLAPVFSSIRVRSDVERKRLAGVIGEHHPAPWRAGLYSPHSSHRTYARLADCAQRALGAGLNVIVDATFLKAADREPFQGLARRLGANFAIVSCTASPATLERRIAARAAGDPSDATAALVHDQLRAADDFTDEETAHVIRVDTGEEAGDPVQSVRKRLAALEA